MEYNIVTSDPLHILTSTKKIIANAKYVTIHQTKLEYAANKIEDRIEKGLEAAETSFGTTGSFEQDVQLIFIENAANFCFWAEKDKPKWQVAYPPGNPPTGGWYSLVRCFQRALAKNIPILEASFLSSLTLEQLKEILRGENETEIPLLERRLENLQEAGKILQKKFNGKFIYALEAANFDAVQIVKLIDNNFKSFQDKATYNGEDIFFLKRAQICAHDIASLSQKYKTKPVKNVQLLTAFADYKLPQMLRHFKAISYSNTLADMVDNYSLIPSGSMLELEIRAATIWCIELIRQKLKKYTAAEIDNALWLLSQDQTNVKPYHRAHSIYY